MEEEEKEVSTDENDPNTESKCITQRAKKVSLNICKHP